MRRAVLQQDVLAARSGKKGLKPLCGLWVALQTRGRSTELYYGDPDWNTLPTISITHLVYAFLF